MSNFDAWWETFGKTEIPTTYKEVGRAAWNAALSDIFYNEISRETKDLLIKWLRDDAANCREDDSSGWKNSNRELAEAFDKIIAHVESIKGV